MPPPSLFPRERLIIYVKERPALFNHNIRSHSDKRLTKKLWAEISSKMRKPVDECRSHWAQLRNIYSTFLRRQKQGKQMNWYLSDSMQFLHDFIRPIGRYKALQAGATPVTDGNGENGSNDDDGQMINENDIKADQYLEMTTSVGGSISIGSGGGGCDDNDDFKGFPPSSVTGSINDDNYSDTPSHKNNYQNQQNASTASSTATPAINSSSMNIEKNLHMSFFENLLPDLNSISARRQRVFKTEVMATLYKLLDEQESDEQNDGSSVPSTNYNVQLSEHSIIKIE